MKSSLSILFVATFTLFLYQAQAQKMSSIKVDPHNLPIICKYHESNTGGHIVLASTQPRNRPANPAIFQAAFDPDMPPAAIAAFDYATQILSSSLSSTVPINVMVSWEDLAPGALAGAGPSEYTIDFPNSTEKTAYPIALAEKIAGVPLNGESRPDIFMSIDSKINWYYDFEHPQNIPSNQFDFVSVVLHEMIHGLGFVGFATVDQNGMGQIKRASLPSIFDIYMANNAGENLCNTIEDPSIQLANIFQSNNLFVRTPQYRMTTPPRLYVPSSFQEGSSIHHLDQITYGGTDNSLMTPSVGSGEVEHNPGISMNILYDLGWSTTTVLHQQKIGEDNANQPYLVNATVTSDLGYDAQSLFLHYSQDTFKTVESLMMTATGEENKFTATIPAPRTKTRIQYYFSIKDNRDITLFFPAEAPNPLFYEIFYEVDTQSPVIKHVPLTITDDKTTIIPIDAIVTDFFTGIDSVYVQYFINGVSQALALLNRDFTDDFRENLYSGAIELSAALTTNDRLEYRIVAIDKSSNKNTQISPTVGLYVINISETFDAVITYLNDFNDSSSDFSGNGFDLSRPSGFTDNAIQSQHPYLSAGEGNTLNFIYQLNIPIQINTKDPLIEFDEIVLVEPGNPNRVYTELEFWDYVIVEGRKIDEQEWKPFLDGYDSNAYEPWRSAYDSSISGQNSNAIGSPDLLNPRTINMVENANFKAGDIVFVRFRLFSDPFAHGWGWAIDNLRIQDTQVAVSDFIEQNDLQIYPNPVSTSTINIEAHFKQTPEDLQINIHDSYGRLLSSKIYTPSSTSFKESIDVDAYSNGIYLITLWINDKESISKKIVKHKY